MAQEAGMWRSSWGGNAWVSRVGHRWWEVDAFLLSVRGWAWPWWRREMKREDVGDDDLGPVVSERGKSHAQQKPLHESF